VKGDNPDKIYSIIQDYAEKYRFYTIEKHFTIIFYIGDETQEESSKTIINLRIHRDNQTRKLFICFQLLSGDATTFENFKNTVKSLF
jgi:hypothetical protein